MFHENINAHPDLASIFDSEWLRAKKEPFVVTPRAKVRIADLFSGIGALSLGVKEACRALNLDAEIAYMLDNDEKALSVAMSNFSPNFCDNRDILNLLNGNFGDSITSPEKELQKRIGKIDFLVGGPPCQGHSDLNNHTRRNDPKNLLFLKMARFSEIFSPKYLIIENVQGVRHDTEGVVDKTVSMLDSLGYTVSLSLLHAVKFGVPQNRRRFFLIASKGEQPDINESLSIFEKPKRDFKWACNDLVNVNADSIFNSSSKHSKTNQERIRYLHAENLYELPNHLRPDCHRLKKHSYNSVYARMYPDQPAPTITGGFGSIGQGRFGHPTKPRSITPHEAARLQFIPDFFTFGDLNRVALQRAIGNAVPPKLPYLLSLILLGRDFE